MRSSSGCGDGEGGRPEALAFSDAKRALFDAHAEAPLYGMTVEQLLELFDAEEHEQRRRDAFLLRLVRELDGRDVAKDVGATGPADLLRSRLLTRPADAHARVRVAKELDRRLVATGTALAAAELSFDHAEVIVSITGQLDAAVPYDVATMVEDDLILRAAELDPYQLRVYGRSVLARVNPDPDDDEEHRITRQSLRLWNRDDGMTEIRGQLATENAALLTAALDPLSAPQPGVNGEPDPRSPGRRRADALGDICRRTLTSGGLPSNGRVRPHIMALVPLETLQGTGTMAGEMLDTGAPLPRSILDTLVCDAAIRRIVFDPASRTVNIGRTQRTVPAAIRAAVIARDRLCTFPSCSRPASWSDCHHLRWWNHGGETAVDNLALVCGHHHRLLHNGTHHIRLGPTGRIEWQAPTWTNPTGTWRTNPIATARDPYATYRTPPTADP